MRSSDRGVRAKRLVRAAVLLCLVELAILVLHDSSHRGPDVSSYASYAQSLTFDGDLLFINEFEAWHKAIFITPTGYASALANIGTAYFWIPFLAAASWVLSLLKLVTPGAPYLASITTSGPDEYYFHALNFANELYGLLTLALCFYFIRRYVARGATLLALCFTALASPFFYFVTYFSPNPSIPSALIATTFLMTWDHARRRARESWPHWFLLGSLGGLLFTLASYNVSLYCFPLLSLADSLRRPGGFRPVLRNGIALGLGSLLAASPQLLTWQILFGRLSNPYAANLDLFHPHIVEVLFSTYHGLYFYAPFLLLATAGIALLARKDRLLALAALATLAAHTYISSITLAWWAGGSFGMRFLLPLTPLFMLGAAALFEAQPRRWLYVVSCLCLFWTYLLFLGIFSGQVDWADFYTLSQQWDNILRALSDLPRLVASHLLTIKSAATPLLLLPFTLLFALALNLVRVVMSSGQMSDRRVALLLGASPLLLVLLTLRAGGVGAANLQAYQSNAAYQAYPRGAGDPADVSYTISERGRYELRMGDITAADADFRRALEVYDKNSWTPLRTSDLELVPNHLDWQFANGVTLAAYHVDESLPAGAAATQVVLYWTAREQAPAAFTLRLQIVEPNGRTLGEQTAVPTQGKVPVQEWKPGTVYREIYGVPYTAPAPGVDSANIQLTLLDPATNQLWPLVNAVGVAPYSITTLKIAR